MVSIPQLVFLPMLRNLKISSLDWPWTDGCYTLAALQ